MLIYRMTSDTDTRDARDVRVAHALMRLGANVSVPASLPLQDLIVLAQAAAERGTMVTLKGAAERSTADLERIAIAARGRVTFDLAG